ncbi:hypothetical protein [Halorussus marinus]|uniref:hypothetical protein n=1 Tax=Halorussus marinus TaxID=2505976 RepID=UPI0010926127|nr:hypothetical protein [Halorussus marinus]
MVRRRLADLPARELVALGLVSLLLVGLAARNVIEADSVEQAIRAVAIVAALGGVFGYRLASRHLSSGRDGALALLAVAFVAGVLGVFAPEAFDAELVVGLAALGLLGLALLVEPHVDLSTRAFGGLLVAVGFAIVAAELTVFDGGRGIVLGALIAVLGAATVVNPEGLEAIDERVGRDDGE